MPHYLAVRCRIQCVHQSRWSLLWHVTKPTVWERRDLVTRTSWSFLLSGLPDLSELLTDNNEVCGAVQLHRGLESVIRIRVSHLAMGESIFHYFLGWKRKWSYIYCKNSKESSEWHYVKFACSNKVCKEVCKVTWTVMTHPKGKDMLSRSSAVKSFPWVVKIFIICQRKTCSVLTS